MFFGFLVSEMTNDAISDLAQFPDIDPERFPQKRRMTSQLCCRYQNKTLLICHIFIMSSYDPCSSGAQYYYIIIYYYSST